MCHSVLPSFTMHYDCVNAEASLPWAQCWTASVTWPHSWRICVIFYVKVSTAALADVRCHEVVVRQRSNFTAVLLNTMTGLGENAELSNVTVDVISVLLWSSYQCFFTIFYYIGDLFIYNPDAYKFLLSYFVCVHELMFPVSNLTKFKEFFYCCKYNLKTTNMVFFSTNLTHRS